MPDSATSYRGIPVESSIPEDTAPLESVLCTEELRHRPWRAPDYGKENRALVALASALADSPRTILQTLAETILEVTQSDSAGVSLLTKDDGGKRFYWPAIAGMWKAHVGGGSPRDFGPCGDVLDRNVPLLFHHLERRYSYFQPVSPPPVESLLVPFYVGKAVGAIWALMHNKGRKFGAEDERLMGALGKAASSAYQALASIDALRVHIGERESSETALNELTHALETRVRVRTEELEQRNEEVKKLRDQLYKENIALREAQAYLAEAQRLSATGSFGWKPSSGEIVWSEETYRMFALDRTTKPTVELVLSRAHPEDRDSMRQLIECAVREAKNWDLELRLLMPGGTLKHLHVVAHAVHDEALSGTEYVGAVMDVTAAKESRQALEKAYAEIQALKDRLQHENIVLREEIDKTSMFEEIVGSSAPLRTVLSHVSKVAPTDSTVLITGETGTGKELVARAIHKRSSRSSRAFVSVNCAAIPASLIASELFGHEKGAFTGAVQRRQGRFELADGGTIFLDEVGELPAEIQMTLLRVLQEREFERVGGSGPIRVNVRVIAATNRDLEAAIAARTFRTDLFYRLNVFPLEMPALRERRTDIPLLVEYFAHRYGARVGKRIRGISKETSSLLQSYDWPGNIRELQNVIERAVIVSDSDSLSIDARWLSGRTVSVPAEPRYPAAVSARSSTLATHEKDVIEAALTESKGRVSGPFGAAARLGVPSSTLESKIKALRIDKRRFKHGPR
jgi:transcriptional regulator with GAF, ATPase, and Fis domain